MLSVKSGVINLHELLNEIISEQKLKTILPMSNSRPTNISMTNTLGM